MILTMNDLYRIRGGTHELEANVDIVESTTFLFWLATLTRVIKVVQTSWTSARKAPWGGFCVWFQLSSRKI